MLCHGQVLVPRKYPVPVLSKVCTPRQPTPPKLPRSSTHPHLTPKTYTMPPRLRLPSPTPRAITQLRSLTSKFPIANMSTKPSRRLSTCPHPQSISHPSTHSSIHKTNTPLSQKTHPFCPSPHPHFISKPQPAPNPNPQRKRNGMQWDKKKQEHAC